MAETITVAGVRYKHVRGGNIWRAGYPHGEFARWDTGWRYYTCDGRTVTSRLLYPTPVEAYIATIDKALDDLEREYQHRHAELVEMKKRAAE